MPDRRLAVAPMMDWTDRHCRYFMRLITPRVRLYTEMLTAEALLHGDTGHLLRFDPAEHPVALQLGGCEPARLAKAATLAADTGYDEINLNCGCPSDRVQAGRFGACLMAEPARVADCVRAMQEAVNVPVTVKCRIGIDDQDSWEHFISFVDTVARAGCDVFIVHARKAWLEGLSPKLNREIPPLDYARVARLKCERPELKVVLNGGLHTAAQVCEHLPQFDGLMVGRSAYNNPWLLAELDAAIFGQQAAVATPHDAVRAMYPYIERELAAGTPLHAMTRHMLGIFQGRPGARAWRRHISEHAHRQGSGIDVVEQALARVPEVEPPGEKPVACAGG